MHFVSRKPLEEFWNKNPIAEGPLKAFFKICEDANWETPHDMETDFGSSNCDKLGNHRYVIDVKGNNIRVIVIIRFNMGRVFCRWVGWYKDYDNINAKTI